MLGVLAIAVMLLGLTSWVGVRAMLARAELEAAIPLASTMQSQVIAGDGDAAKQTGERLGNRAASATSLTSDPVWRAFEFVPALGPNLAAVRQLAAVVDDLAQRGVMPLAEVAGAITAGDFQPVDGAINAQPLIDAKPAVSAAAAAVRSARKQVEVIDTSSTFAVVTAATERLSSAVAEAETAISAVDNAVTLVPAILGADGPRNYLVLFQNPAELRSTGGIAGAVALLHTDGGRIELTQQLSSGGVDEYDSPVLDLPTETRALYGDITARFIQDVNLTPNFVQSGEIASEMWSRQFGQELDGVLSIDPVALGYLLAATGPVTLATGDQLTSENAVQLLLTDVYVRYPNPVEQDAFFAAAASSVFSAVAGGNVDPVGLVTALARAGSEHRVLVWSANPDEQAVLAGTTLAGGLPLSDRETQRIGVYLNDATGSKMGPYLDVQSAVGASTCRQDRRSTTAVEVTLTNTAPLDAAASLPSYVTADGNFGVAAGNIKVILSIYGVPNSQNLGLTRDGIDTAHHATTDSSYPVSSTVIELAPGESTTIRSSWLGETEFTGVNELQMTPVIHRNETQKLDIAC